MIRAAILGIAGLVAISAAAAAQDSAQTDQEGSRPIAGAARLQDLRDQALSLVNEARRKHALGTFDSSETLNKAAQEHAEDMLDRGYYSHVSPEGETVEDRYRDHGGSRWQRVAENIASCEGCETPPTRERIARFHDGWMRSPGHRENILMEGLESFGFGIAGSKGRVYAVQTFAGPGTPPDLASGEEPVVLSPDEQIQRAVQAVNHARERENLGPLVLSEVLSEVANKLLPEDGAADDLIDAPDDPFTLLPGGHASSWRRLQILAAACGGCGTQPTAADIRYFANQWSKNPEGDRAVLQGDVSHMGFAMQADGTGRKTAVAVLGQRLGD